METEEEVLFDYGPMTFSSHGGFVIKAKQDSEWDTPDLKVLD